MEQRESDPGSPDAVFIDDPRRKLRIIVVSGRVDRDSQTPVGERLDQSIAAMPLVKNMNVIETRLGAFQQVTHADVTFTGNELAQNVVYRIRRIHTESHWIEVKLRTTSDHYSRYDDLFEQILSSVEERN